MTVAAEIVPIEHLIKHIGRKVGVTGSGMCGINAQPHPTCRLPDVNTHSLLITSHTSFSHLLIPDSMQAHAHISIHAPPHTSRSIYSTSQAPVDVMGIIVGLGAPGSIKRKSDNSDVQRRDVTLVDQG